MKKSFNIFLAALAVMTVSCVKENAPQTEEPLSPAGEFVFQAVAPADVTVGALGTKTVMVPENEAYAVNWTDTDAISVNGTASTAIEVAEDDAKNATFTVSGVNAPFCAVYPAAVASEFTQEAAVITLPDEQKYVAGSFDPAASVMLGYMAEEEGSLSFSHAMSYLYLTINTVSDYDTDNIRYVNVKSLGEEPMSGAFEAAFGVECTMAPAEGTASTEVTLDCGEAGVAKGTPVVIAIPAGTYASGLVITITDVNDDVTTQTAATELVFKPGFVYTANLRVAAPGIYNVAGYNAFAKAVNAGDYSAWKDNEGVVNLYADITSDENYTYISNFDGTFDGNGHTITCTKKTRPLFNNLAKTAVVKNLTTAGTYTGFENQGEQAFASFARVNLGHIYKCNNTTDCSQIESITSAIVFGGFVGQNGGVIEECVNDADIKLVVSASDKMACFGGGLAAYGHTVIGFSSADNLNVDGNCSAGKFIKCVNNGDISVSVKAGYIARASFGGVCGMVIMDGVTFTDCENTGNISRMSSGESNPGADAASTLGGICGRSAAWFKANVEALDAAAANLGGFNTIFSGCKNSGELVQGHRNDRNLQADAINRDDYIGGIVGAAVGKGTSTPLIENCTLEISGKVLTGFNTSNTSHIAGGIAGLATNATFSGCNVYGQIGSNGSNCVAAAGGVAGLTVGTVNISGGIVKPVLSPRKSSSFNLSYGLLVGSAFNGCVLKANDVACGGSISVGGSDKGVASSNYNDFLCVNSHFSVTPTFTNCNWAE